MHSFHESEVRIHDAKLIFKCDSRICTIYIYIGSRNAKIVCICNSLNMTCATQPVLSLCYNMCDSVTLLYFDMCIMRVCSQNIWWLIMMKSGPDLGWQTYYTGQWVESVLVGRVLVSNTLRRPGNSPLLSSPVYRSALSTWLWIVEVLRHYHGTLQQYSCTSLLCLSFWSTIIRKVILVASPIFVLWRASSCN